MCMAGAGGYCGLARAGESGGEGCRLGLEAAGGVSSATWTLVSCQPVFKGQLLLQPQASDIPSLSLIFCICKMGIS